MLNSKTINVDFMHFTPLDTAPTEIWSVYTLIINVL